MPQSERSGGILGCCGYLGDNLVGDDDNNAIPKPRGCTDIVWLIVYVIFCCILVLIACFALVYGNPKRLINGMDSFGNVCGSTNQDFDNMSFSGMDMTDKPYTFYFDLSDMDRSTRICVSECPHVIINEMAELQEYAMNVSINYCRYDFNISEWTPTKSAGRASTGSILEFDNIFCPSFPVYASHPILKRCVPIVDNSPGMKMFNLGRLDDIFPRIYHYLNSLNLFQQILGDLASTWVTVLGLTLISFVISLCLVVVLHWMTTLVAYIVLILSSVFSIVLTGYLWWTFIDIRRILETTPDDFRLEEMERNKCYFFTYSIVSTIFTIILLLVNLVVRKRVTIVVKLFREAGSAMMSMPCLWVQPFITYVALSSFFCAWLYIVLCIATSDYPETRHIPSLPAAGVNNLAATISAIQQHANHTNSGIEDSSASDLGEIGGMGTSNKTRLSWDDVAGWTLIEYSDETWVKYMWFIYIFGLIWCSEFILACQQMVIASSVATWYFSRSRNSLNCIVLKSISRMIQFHIGSIALGSLIITFIKLPRLILQFTQKIFRKWDDYQIVKWLSRCCICCLKCFECAMKYVHHNAYTVISIQGVNFCPASRLAFSALVQNALQISVINSIGDFVLFLAKCITASLTGLIALAIFRRDETLYYYAIPVLLTIVFSYFVAHCVLSVFEMAVDTLFLCFCEDHNMNDGTDGKPFYAPTSFLQYMTIDAVDAIAPGRRSHLESPSHLKKSQMTDFKEAASPEEIIPMNPYHETTTPNNDD